MAWFGEFRGGHGFSWYDENRTAADTDIPVAAVVFFCIVVSIATLIASLGIRGRERWTTALRAIYALATGSIILVGLYSHYWQVGTVEVKSTYVYRSSKHFRGEVGIRVGLHGANVTLIGYFGENPNVGYVYYSEALPWADYGLEASSFLEYVQRGLPDPILKIAEHLCVDEGGLRWGKTFHIAGNLSCALLWTAFAFWIVTNILLFSVMCYGSYFFLFTGLTMVLSCIVYHLSLPADVLVVKYGTKILQTHYGWSFWLVFVSGVTTCVLGLLLVTLDYLLPERLAGFFSLETEVEIDKGEYLGFKTVKEPDRRGSIFHTPSRSGSLFSEGEKTENRRTAQYFDDRRASFFGDPLFKRTNLYGPGAGWLNRGFVSDGNLVKLNKTNPLYSEHDSITEELYDTASKSELQEVRIGIEEDDDDTSVKETGSTSGSGKNDTDNDTLPLTVLLKPSLLSHDDSGNESCNVHVHDNESCSSGSGDCGMYDDRRVLARKT